MLTHLSCMLFQNRIKGQKNRYANAARSAMYSAVDIRYARVGGGVTWGLKASQHPIARVVEFSRQRPNCRLSRCQGGNERDLIKETAKEATAPRTVSANVPVLRALTGCFGVHAREVPGYGARTYCTRT